MLNWLASNLVTIIAILVIAGLVALAVFSIVRDKKQGRAGCGHKCSGCPMSGSCHHV